jgi:iron complex transport system permease protein
VAAVGGSVIFLVAALAFGVLFGMSNGHVTWLDLGAALGGDRSAWEILMLSRLPRALAGAVAGAGLAASGVAFQGILRNPLAEPFTLGVSSGAALGAVIAIRLGLDAVLGAQAVPLAAFAGSMASVTLVWRLSRVGSSHPPATLLLAGITLAFFCSAASMLVQYTASFSESYRIVRWMMGGLDWILYKDIVPSAAVVAIGVVALGACARDFNALAAGADAAASVGVAVDRVVAISFVAASLIVGAVIAFAGPIGFVGIIVPHVMRALVGPDHRVLLPTAVFGGAGLVIVADTAARSIISPAQLPVGVVTALLGGPFFMFLLLGEKGRSRLWS